MPNDYDDKLRILFENVEDKITMRERVIVQNRAEAVKFLNRIVLPAYRHIQDFAAEQGYETEVRDNFSHNDEFPVLQLTIEFNAKDRFGYQVKVRYNDFQILARPYVLDVASQDFYQTSWATTGGYFIYAVTTDMIKDSIINEIYRTLK